MAVKEIGCIVWTEFGWLGIFTGCWPLWTR